MGVLTKIMWITFIASILACVPPAVPHPFSDLMLDFIFAVLGSALIFMWDHDRVSAIVYVLWYVVTIVITAELLVVGLGL
jgi:hypothetical protein